MNNNIIGKNIAYLRKKKKLTQQELGDKLHVTDKAVSKWERGLSLPDISILENLSKILDSDIYEILQIENKKKVDIDKKLLEEKLKIKKQVFRKNLIIIFPIAIIICLILFKLIPFGYNIVPIRYENNETKLINLGVPKFSFLIKNNHNNYSFKNFRGKNILKTELKSYANTLEHITCNNTTYYYDKASNTTIIDYDVTSNILYSNISYNIRNGNYCNTLEIKEYQNKLGGIGVYKVHYSENKTFEVRFNPNLKINNNENEWTAFLAVYFNNEIIERSTGTFEINDDELIYYRTNIENKSDKIEIPTVSHFVIKEESLILKENYLKDYTKGIILR